jgi:hypothetical protein
MEMAGPAFRFKSFLLLLAFALTTAIGGVYLNAKFGISFQSMQIAAAAVAASCLAFIGFRQISARRSLNRLLGHRSPVSGESLVKKEEQELARLLAEEKKQNETNL